MRNRVAGTSPKQVFARELAEYQRIEKEEIERARSLPISHGLLKLQ
jgi:hypothetical protein